LAINAGGLHHLAPARRAFCGGDLFFSGWLCRNKRDRPSSLPIISKIVLHRCHFYDIACPSKTAYLSGINAQNSWIATGTHRLRIVLYTLLTLRKEKVDWFSAPGFINRGHFFLLQKGRIKRVIT
jgi:hypothetical protein